MPTAPSNALTPTPTTATTTTDLTTIAPPLRAEPVLGAGTNESTVAPTTHPEAPLVSVVVQIPVPAGDDLVPLVDANDVVVGVKVRSALGVADRSRVVNAFVQRPDGLLWTPTRTTSQARFPGALDFAIGDHVLVGESYFDALVRAGQTKLGLDLTQVNTQPVLHLGPDDGVSDHMEVYVIRLGVVERPNTDLYASWQWCSPSALAAMVAARTPSKPDLTPVLAAALRLLDT